MANEIHLTYNAAAANLYALIRRTSDAKVWDPSLATPAWATWADGSLGNYDLPLTDKGGGLYTVTFPATVTAQTEVHIQIRERAGASPALTDYIRDARTLVWTGTALVEPGSGYNGTIYNRVNNLVGASAVSATDISGTEEDISYFRGDTKLITFDLSRDITSATFKFTVKAAFTDLQADAKIAKTSAAGAIVITDAAAGTLTVALAAADTSELLSNGKVGRFVYDLEMTDANGKVETVAWGIFNLYPDVTTAS